MSLVPKYFKNLHLVFSSITHLPRIANIDLEKNPIGCTDKYIDVPIDEFIGVVTAYFQHLEKGEKQGRVMSDWSFVVGGNAKSRENLIELLEKTIEEVKRIPVQEDEQE